MLPYVFIYSFSTICIFLLTKKRNRQIEKIGIFLALLLICIFSGLRDFTVGRDVLTYGNYVFEGAVRSFSWFNYTNFTSGNERIEVGYLGLNFLVSRFTSSLHIFYFIHAFLVNGISFFALYKYKKYVNFSLLWFMYLMLVYPYTLTMLRQSLAQSLIFLGITLLLVENRFFTSAILIFLSILFHDSALIGIVLYLLSIMFIKSKVSSKQVVFLLAVAFVLGLFSEFIVDFFINLGILSKKYTMYKGTKVNLSIINPLLLRIPLLLLIYSTVWKNKEKKKNPIVKTIVFFVLLETILQPIKLIDSDMSRILWYFNLFMTVGYSFAFENIKIDKYTFSKGISLFLLIIFVIYIGMYSNIYEQKNGLEGLGLYPYMFYFRK